MIPARSKYKLVIMLIIFGMLGYAYFGITALLDPSQLVHGNEKINDSGTLFAQYMGVRNLAMIALVIFILTRKQIKVLAYFLLLSGIIQSGDTVIGATQGDLVSTIFPAIFAALYFLSFRFLLKNENQLQKN